MHLFISKISKFSIIETGCIEEFWSNLDLRQRIQFQTILNRKSVKLLISIFSKVFRQYGFSIKEIGVMDFLSVRFLEL